MFKFQRSTKNNLLHLKFIFIEYKSIGCAAVLYLFGYCAYKRVGIVWLALGGFFRSHEPVDDDQIIVKNAQRSNI